jgi:hypothetical protein
MKQFTAAFHPFFVVLDCAPLLCTVLQALVSPLPERAGTTSGMYRNAPASLDAKRLFSLCMIMEKYVPTLELYDKAVMVNVVGGVQASTLWTVVSNDRLTDWAYGVWGHALVVVPTHRHTVFA